MTEALTTHDIECCPGCRSTRSRPFLLGGTPLRRCDDCALTYGASYADPSEVYVEGYLFGNTEFGLDVMHPLFQEFLAYAAAKRLDVIEKVIGPDASLLDVGCGTGEVLAVARDRGWTVAGAEPVVESATYASEKRGLDVAPAILQESGFPERSFDVVTAFHVVEHMVDSQGFLQMMSRWAKPGGYVVVEVPNWHSFHRRNAGAGWSGLRPLEHVGHYGPATMKATMKRAGLEPVMVRTPGFLWENQTLDQQLDDLGLYRLKGRTQFLGKSGLHNDGPAVVPRRATAGALLGLQAAYNRLGVGQVVFAIARVA